MILLKVQPQAAGLLQVSVPGDPGHSCQEGDVTAQVSAPPDRALGTGSPSCAATPLPSAGSQGPGGKNFNVFGSGDKTVSYISCSHLIRSFLPSFIRLLSTFSEAGAVPQGTGVGSFPSLWGGLHAQVPWAVGHPPWSCPTATTQGSLARVHQTSGPHSLK